MTKLFFFALLLISILAVSAEENNLSNNAIVHDTATAPDEDCPPTDDAHDVDIEVPDSAVDSSDREVAAHEDMHPEGEGHEIANASSIEEDILKTSSRQTCRRGFGRCTVGRFCCQLGVFRGCCRRSCCRPGFSRCNVRYGLCINRAGYTQCQSGRRIVPGRICSANKCCLIGKFSFCRFIVRTGRRICTTRTGKIPCGRFSRPGTLCTNGRCCIKPLRCAVGGGCF